MQQTAVEWLAQKLIDSGVNFLSDELKFIEQAKQMEKQQLLEAWDAGWNECSTTDSFSIDAEEYYDATYKK